MFVLKESHTSINPPPPLCFAVWVWNESTVGESSAIVIDRSFVYDSKISVANVAMGSFLPIRLAN